MYIYIYVHMYMCVYAPQMNGSHTFFCTDEVFVLPRTSVHILPYNPFINFGLRGINREYLRFLLFYFFLFSHLLPLKVVLKFLIWGLYLLFL